MSPLSAFAALPSRSARPGAPRLASLLARCVAALALASAACGAWAQAWPAKPVTMIVGYPAGSGIDAVARFLSEQLRERTGQPFIVENRPGAVGNLAAQAVARAAPDGYTLLFTPNSTHAANPHLFKNLGFDPIRDFQPVTTLLTLGFVLVVNPQTVPVNSVAELSDYLKARPGKLAYGSGNATGRIAAEMYRQAVGFDAVHVPYKGVPQAITDLLGGQIHFLFADATLAVPQVRSGKVRALAVTNGQRISASPDWPTMAEAGVKGYELSGWFALFFPAKTPKDLAQRLADHANAIMTGDKGRAFLRNLGADPFPGSPDQLGKFVEGEIAKWGRIVKQAGIEPE